MSLNRPVELAPTSISTQVLSHDIASPEDYDVDAHPTASCQIHDGHEDKADADMSVSSTGVSCANNSPERSVVAPPSTSQMAPANVLASLDPSTSSDSTRLCESGVLFAPAEDSEPAPLSAHQLSLETSESAPDEPTALPPNFAYLPSTLYPSMDTDYWLKRQWCLDNYGYFDTSVRYASAPDTVSGPLARPCITARTLYKMTSQIPELTARSGSVLSYVADIDVHCPETADGPAIELVAAQDDRPEITLTGCVDGAAGPEMDVLSWEALGRPTEEGLAVYREVTRGHKNVCLEDGGCGECKEAGRMNGMAMQAFGVGGVDGQEAEKVEEGKGKWEEVVVLAKIRNIARIFRIREGEKSKEKEQGAAGDKSGKTQEKNVKEVNERRKREERKAEKKAKDLAKWISDEALKKVAKSLPRNKSPTPCTS
jgi:hypothetical protein